MKTTASLPILVRTGAVSPKSYNADTRTVEMDWTTGAIVRRDTWDRGEYDEELVVSQDTIDMGRLASGNAPVLNSHNNFDLRDVIGVVEEAWLLGPKGQQKGRARIRFSERESIAEILQDVRSGIIRNVSVGYKVHEYTKTERKGDVPLMKATRWEPFEISLVPIGADGAAQVRSSTTETYPCQIRTEHDEESKMANKSADETEVSVDVTDAPEEKKVETAVIVDADDDPTPLVAAADDTRSAALSVEELTRQAVEADRYRSEAIMDACAFYRVPAEDGKKMVREGIALEEAQKRIARAAFKAQKDTHVTSIHLGDSRDEGKRKSDALENAILHRCDSGKYPLTEQARDAGYQHLRLVEVAKECLDFAGVKHRGMSPFQIVDTALKPQQVRMGGLHTTSDFANILSGVIYTSLRAAYERATPTYVAWARRSTVPDYRDVNRVILYGPSSLGRVNEHGEYPRGTMTDGKETYRILKYGEIIGVTREVIVNDNLGAFNRIPDMLAQQARQLESDLVYAVLLQNAALSDGVALFHATHANLNLGSAAVINATSVGAAYSGMAIQTEPTSGAPLNLTPSFLLVPPGIRSAAEVFVNGVYVPGVITDIVPEYLRRLTVITEARLASGVTLRAPLGNTVIAGDINAWYLLAAPSMIDTVEYAYLEGQEGLYTETRNGFEVDGVEIKCRLDFGAKALDYRGMVKNDGA